MSENKQTRHTVFAAAAISRSEMFAMVVGKQKVAGTHTSFTPEMAAPEGESTGGGKQALQHLSLVPEDGSGTLTVGHVNTAAKRAELRTCSHVTAIHAERFKGAALPISRTDYDAFLDRVQKFLQPQGFQVVQIEMAFRSSAPAPIAQMPDDDQPAIPGRSRSLLVIATVAVVVVAAALFLLRR